MRRKGDVTARPPYFKNKYHFTTMAHNQSGFKLGHGCIKLSHKRPLAVPLSFAIPKFHFGRVCQVAVFQDEKGRYSVSVVHEVDPPEYFDNGLYQAFDRSITKHTAVNTHGKFVEFANSRHDKYWS